MQRLRNHLLFWFTYVAFKTYLNLSAETVALLSADDQWQLVSKILIVQFSILGIKVPLVYSTFYLADAYLLRGWALLRVIAALLLVFTLAVLCMTVLNHTFILPIVLEYTGTVAPILSIDSLLYHFFTLSFVVGAANAIRLFRRQHHSRLREVALQKEKTEAELNYLKSQINPHFLFNTLNNIYSLARKGAPQTAEAVLKLSKLMRFMLYEASHSTILLSDELKLIQDYIALEKLRYTDRLVVTYTEVIDNAQQRIAPLLIIHFVENAFKHGASESRFDTSISIAITLKEKVLKAAIRNSKATNTESTTTPIGMENIQRQLQLVYPQHQLVIDNTSDYFSVDLTIPLPA